MTSQPLSGIKIVDLSRVLAGPLCTMMLADLGADVIKVERPGSGDDTRGWGPPFAKDGQSAYFRSVNRNKLGITLDLDAAADQQWLLAMMREADVVVDNFLPGVLARKGLEAGSILEEMPQLIWCTISGFGPDSQRPGYDFVVQAECGWMSMTGPIDGEPHKVGVALADVIAGKDAATAILAALVARGRTPARSATERRIHVSLRDSATAALINVAQNTLVTGQSPQRWGNGHPSLVPYELFQARDRALVVAVGNDRQWADCARAFGLMNTRADHAEPLGVDHAEGEAREGLSPAGAALLATDCEMRPVLWPTNADRVVHRDALIAQLSAVVATDDAAVWIGRLSAVGVPCGVVRTVSEALADVSCDPVTGVAPATGGMVWGAPPQLNEHGDALRQVGWRLFDQYAR